MKTTDYLTTSDAAQRLGITTMRIRQLIAAERFPGAIHPGRDWLLPAREVFAYQRRKPGRPKIKS